MGIVDVLVMGRHYGNQWVVLDRTWSVVDHGSSLSRLRLKHGAQGGCTFYYVAG